MPLPFLPPEEKGFHYVPAVEGLVRHKNVALRALGVSYVTLLQYQNCVIHMAVWKMKTEVGPL